MPKKVFIGVAWPYVNGDIHIGHPAGYLLPADIFARFHRYLGNDVLMVSGSDCFGTPITLEADKRKVSPEKIVEEYHAKNVRLLKELGISFDLYTKTDNPNHKEIVQDFFVKLLERGLILKKETEQYYSPEEKRFLPDRYVEGKCPYCGYGEARSDQCDNCGRVLSPGELVNPKNKNSGKPAELKPTEHYFLDWPKLQPFLDKYVGEAEGWRNWVFKETEGWLKTGLKPRAITRDLDWGVEIPVDRIPKDLQIDNYEHKRIYVWFEAVIGYFSASVEWAKINGKKWEDFWHDKNSLHAYFMGKDNLVFHTLFWPGQLHAYDEKLHLPDLPVINQFLNLEGRKFSKSRGITIDSRYFVETYGLDALRFYLTLIAPEAADTDFTWADFVSKNNDILIGNLGNFVNRTLTLAQGFEFDGKSIDAKLAEKTIQFVHGAKEALSQAEFKKYLEFVLAVSHEGNKYLASEEPWFLKEKEPKKFKTVIENALFIVLALHLVVKPLLPDAAEKLGGILSVNFENWPADEAKEIKKSIARIKISNAKPLFSKIDEKIIEIERAKLKLQ